MTGKRALLTGAVLLAGVWVAVAQEPLRTGLTPGQRPGPYSAVVVTGAQRGQSHCYVCETADRPAVIIMARTTSDALGKLAKGVDRAVADHKSADLRAWLTFLAEDQAGIDAKLVKWSQQHALGY